MRARTVKPKKTNESLLINHRTYDVVPISKFSKVKVGPDGMLADNGVHVDWATIEKFLKKYKKP